MKLTVGQKLWFVPSDRRGNHSEVTVEKIGRKWATLDCRYRIDLVSLRADGGEYSSPGACYLNEQVYLEERMLLSAWNAFKRRIEHIYQPPIGVDISNIQHVTNVLRLDE